MAVQVLLSVIKNPRVLISLNCKMFCLLLLQQQGCNLIYCEFFSKEVADLQLRKYLNDLISELKIDLTGF